jgi:GNAT superfamily N-acetyltransferase
MEGRAEGGGAPVHRPLCGAGDPRVIVRELGPGETHLAARTLLELRPHHGSPEALARQVDERQRPAGYRLVGVFEDGAEEAAAVAGFRINEFLAWGKHIYVDDLVTAEAARGRGLADRLFAWLEDEARHCGCTQFHLDSGLGEDRQDAHRFYFRHGLRIASYHFAREL